MSWLTSWAGTARSTDQEQLGQEVFNVCFAVTALLALGLFVIICIETVFCGPAVLITLGFFMSAVLIGFLFGVPKVASASASEVPSDERRRIVDVNTNLEQISDWLTKIIVGLGLIELKAIPAGISRLAAFIVPAFHASWSGESVAIGVIIYFPTLGFMGGYLLTRLYLASLIARSDRVLDNVATQAKVSALLGAAATVAKTGQSVEVTSQEVAKAAEQVSSAVSGGRSSNFKRSSILWVDDQPENNDYLTEAFQQLGIRVDTARSTDEALETLNRGRHYSVIISDMSRPPDERAGYTLLQKLRERKETTPVIIFSSAETEEQRKEARAAGAVDSTNRAPRVFELVMDAIAK